MNRNVSKYEDEELLKLYYETRDNSLLGELLRRYTLLLFGVCMKYLKDTEEARDAVQQVHLKAINELQKYKVQYVKSWLYMIARNHCLMKLRDRRPTQSADNLSNLEAEDEFEQKKERFIREDNLKLLEESLQHLNGEQRTCIELFYLQKKSYQEVAAATGYSLLQVKSFIQNGKRNLKIMLLKKLRHE